MQVGTMAYMGTVLAVVQVGVSVVMRSVEVGMTAWMASPVGEADRWAFELWLRGALCRISGSSLKHLAQVHGLVSSVVT